MTESTACPHCGAEIDFNAKFCRHCGSSDADGWRDEFGDEQSDELDEGFDYDEFVANEFSDSLANTQTSPLWRFVAVVLLIVFTFGFLFVLF